MKQKIPNHVAIVMDGNGRWAERHGLPRVEGHSAGIEKVKSTIHFCLARGIGILSLFAFSTENWRRPEKEVDCLMKLFIHVLKKEIHSLHKNGVSLRFIGDRSQFSQALQQQMHASETLTDQNQKLILNVAMNYSGKWDILHAAKHIYEQIADKKITLDEMDETLFSRHLSSGELSDPDLLIRTSGEQRISNFFLWQLAYTELYFSDVHWPDFSEEEFEKALQNYSLRERRFGQISKQLHEQNHV
ncbi:isoprenyl transferase [Legionella impletisoli]|uniref:isoprenyl transferase n=1 Tax=Legionella impletisoli TaxID=343510 RepID=UPI001041AE93|nr:isoprenyl transferase [Legionella impletisoli]